MYWPPHKQNSKQLKELFNKHKNVTPIDISRHCRIHEVTLYQYINGLAYLSDRQLLRIKGAIEYLSKKK